MKAIKTILKDADPLEHEPSWTIQERNVIRQQVISSAFDAHVKPAGWSLRIPIAAVAIIVALAVIVGLGFGPGIWSRAVTNVHAAVPFEMRLAEDRPGPGLLSAKVASDRTIYLFAEVLVTNSDIARAAVIPGRAPGVYDVDVLFTAEGAAKMNRATAEHIGRPIALLVDGNVINAPTVRAAIGDSAIINGNFTQAEAEIMAAGIDKH